MNLVLLESSGPGLLNGPLGTAAAAGQPGEAKQRALTPEGPKAAPGNEIGGEMPKKVPFPSQVTSFSSQPHRCWQRQPCRGPGSTWPRASTWPCSMDKHEKYSQLRRDSTPEPSWRLVEFRGASLGLLCPNSTLSLSLQNRSGPWWSCLASAWLCLSLVSSQTAQSLQRFYRAAL